MTKKICMIIITSLLAVLTGSPVSASDWQFWHSEGINGAISGKCDLALAKEFRLGRNINELYYHHTDLGIKYRLCDWFKLGLNYRQVFEKKYGSWIEESRPHINGIFAWKWGDVRVETRNRLEFRNIENKGTATRYRNKLTLKFPGGEKIFPYLADEIFIQGYLNRNRLYLGFKSEVIKNVNGNFCYIWQSSKKDDHWADAHILAIYLSLKVKF
ncbi:MAG: DUF2490 domain-containing protein [Candidatus Eremiobacteraeota bacterium]|nr:DUF2490 domain-containing protein [Candidatus Eremiobacteraeota bacterium]